MDKNDAKSYRLARANELRKLGEILQREGIVLDVSPLMIAAGTCGHTRDSENDNEEEDEIHFWKYRIEGLRFVSVDSNCLKHVKPEEARNVYIELSVGLTGLCLSKFVCKDPFTNLGITIVARGENRNCEELICAWHLDRHTHRNGSNTGEFVHPVYHFQYGGTEVYDLTSFGNALLLETPRIAHPPLDGLLAVDFVLSNYFSEIYSILKEDAEYQKIMREAQERIWAPYTLAAFNHWSHWRDTEVNWETKDIFPQVIDKDLNL